VAPGKGSGLGTVPLLAQPVVTIDASSTESQATRIVILMSVYRRNSLVA
jgi:hypothetical protein